MDIAPFQNKLVKTATRVSKVNFYPTESPCCRELFLAGFTYSETLLSFAQDLFGVTLAREDYRLGVLPQTEGLEFTFIVSY